MQQNLWFKIKTGDPHLMRTINGWAVILWVVMIPISYFSGWLNSVIYVSALSLWALVSAHLSSWQAARVEVRQEDDNDVHEVMLYIKEFDKRLCKASVIEPSEESRKIMQELEESVEEDNEEEKDTPMVKLKKLI